MNRGKRYRQYLQSADWKSKRQFATDAAEGRCQLCNAGPPLQVLHRTYENVPNERPGDLIVLCVGCHFRFHRKPRPDVSKAERRKQLDEQILAILGSGPMTYKRMKAQLRAPAGQIWSRTRKLINAKKVEWCRGGTQLQLKES